MKTAGNFVSLAAKLASGMERSHDGLQSGYLGGLVRVHRDAASIVYNSYAVTGKESDLYIICKTSHGLVTGIIEYLCYEVVQAVRTSSTYIHAWTLANRLQSFKHGDRGGIIA